jgi:hypothetical protein
MASVIDHVAVDSGRTFNGPAIYLGCEPKMVRADKTDPTSQEVQGRDNNGGGFKWTCNVAVKFRAFERDKNEILSVTLTAPQMPCGDLQMGMPVLVEGLEMGLMRQDRGGFSQFWSAAGIRAAVVRSQAQQSHAAASHQ